MCVKWSILFLICLSIAPVYGQDVDLEEGQIWTVREDAEDNVRVIIVRIEQLYGAAVAHIAIVSNDVQIDHLAIHAGTLRPQLTELIGTHAPIPANFETGYTAWSNNPGGQSVNIGTISRLITVEAHLTGAIVDPVTDAYKMDLMVGQVWSLTDLAPSEINMLVLRIVPFRGRDIVFVQVAGSRISTEQIRAAIGILAVDRRAFEAAVEQVTSSRDTPSFDGLSDTHFRRIAATGVVSSPPAQYVDEMIGLLVVHTPKPGPPKM
jgi:hypothetical protein